MWTFFLKSQGHHHRSSTDQWCPDGERARALILVPSRVSPGFMSLRPGAECGSARLDSNSPSLLHPPFPYYHTHSSSSHSHIRIDKQTCMRINTRGGIWLHSQLPSARVYGDYQLIIAINSSILVNNCTRSAAECHL